MSKIELNFSDLFGIIWKRKSMVFGTIFATLFGAIVFLHLTTFQYTAFVKTTPTQPENSAGQIQGLATLAGIGMSQDAGISPFTLYVNILRSRQVAILLTHDKRIMQTVFADQWDRNAGQWFEPKSMAKSLSKRIKSLIGVPTYQWTPPSAELMESYLAENLLASKDINDPIVTLTFRHPDAEFARYFLKRVHESADQLVRARTLERTEKYIEYLSAKLNTITVAEHRQAIVESLISQERTSMMAGSGVNYAAEAIGQVAVSEHPNSPAAMLILFVAMFFGGFASLVLALFLEYRSMKIQLEDGSRNRENTPLQQTAVP